ncbi:uncharacterized protein LOC111580096 isoform X3 [Amphiprion ocellaris]|nr:uncharacterized protein LOC111580096 isoform X3 [Amphiprion ocellaris]
MFDFSWQDRTWCIDAAREDGSLGRLVNDDHKHPNCRMKKLVSKGKPHLCLFALRDINPGEEITYDYGENEWPWRKQAGLQQMDTKSSEAEISRTESSPQPSTSSQIQAGLQQMDTKSSEAEISRTESSPQTSTSSQIQAELQQTDTKFSEAEISGTQSSPQPSTSSQIQAGLQQMDTKSSEAEISRTESSPQTSTSSQIQAGLQQMDTKSSEAEISRTESSPQPSTSSQIQAGLQQMDTKSSEAEISRTESSPQPSTSSQIQAGLQQTDTKSSEAEISRTESSPQPSTSSQIQAGLQQMDTKSSEAEISRTESSPQTSTSSQIQAGLQQMDTKSSEAEISRTESSPQPSTSSQIQAELQQTDTKFSEAEISGTQSSPQPSTFSQIQDEVQQMVSESSEPPITRGDHVSLPRLRRTKSIQMNSQVHFDPDDLFDLTSDDSGEEFIPKSCEASSDDTDTSEVIERINKDPSKPRFPHLSLTDGMEERCPPTTNLDSDFSKQVLLRGRSCSTQGKSSGGRHKKRRLSIASSPTQTCIDHSSKRSQRRDTGTLSATSTLDLEPKLPDSTTSPPPEDGVTDCPLSIPAVCKTESGSRVYNKKQYCVYCKIGVLKIARHLERAHLDKPEVEQAMSFPKGSKERRMHLEHLRNRGNFSHNVDVLKSGVGNLVPRKQPKQDSQAQNYLHCAYCRGFFKKKLLWQHMKICKFKPRVSQKPGKSRVQALCAFVVPPPPGVNVEFWKLLSNMVQDEVCSAVKSDVCIMEYGQHLYHRLGYDVGKHEYIRQKLRELGRLLVCSRKTTPLKTIEDHIKPANFMQVVQTVKRVAGYDEETSTYKCPSLALKIGHSLTKISLLVESRANIQNNHSAAKDARTFRRVYETRWNELVSAASLRTLQESKWNTPLLLPFTKDVQTLHSYLDVQQQQLHSELSTETSPQVWTQLAKVTLAQVILFNRRRAGEVSKMPLSAYLSRNPSDPQEDVNLALSDLEKKLCQHFKRVEIRGKRGRKVPVLLTPAMQQALDLLVSTRKECGVPQENIYLFARPSAFTCYRGSDCLRHFAKVCGAKSPESLTSTKLRKQTGTLSQVLNLSNTELDQLAVFLGHDITVHRQFYRLPEGTLQLAKISKILMALDQGRLAEFKGRTLDDINIDPEENVHMDSEDEEASDLQESSVTSGGEEKETAMPDVSHRDAALQESSMTPPQAHPSQLPKRGRGCKPVKRRMWEKEEIRAVEKHMMSFINTCRVPGKSDCEKCLELEKVALKGRDWLGIKFYIKNRITALKNKV